MATIKLIYFPVKGRLESIRTLLVDNNIEYEEVNCAKNWYEEWKPKMLFGQTPCLIDGDVKLVQSNAILRYLARKLDLYGSDYRQAAIIDMINDGVEDVRIGYTKLIYQNYEAGKDDYIKTLGAKLQPFESHLKENKGYILGEDKMTFADYNLFDLLDIHLVLAPQCLDNFPTLKAYHKRVSSRDGVKKRRETDDFKNMKINGNDNQ